MIILSWNYYKDRRLCEIADSNFEPSLFVSTSSRTLTIALQSGKTATVAVVGTEGLRQTVLQKIGKSESGDPRLREF